MKLKNQVTFRRYEKKYLVTQQQYDSISESILSRVLPDRFAACTISNIYYDTPKFQLIRKSLDGPIYKEKIRLRTYQTPSKQTEAFIEIKKKFVGVVYKRRTEMAYGDAVRYLGGSAAPKEEQIIREVDYFLRLYPELQPAMCIFYDRLAFFDKHDPELRMTFDSNIRWRTQELDLMAGTWGQPLLEPQMRLLEIKIPGCMPVWLARALSDAEIYPVSFSKYGLAYKTMLGKQREETKERAEGGVICA